MRGTYSCSSGERIASLNSADFGQLPADHVRVRPTRNVSAETIHPDAREQIAGARIADQHIAGRVIAFCRFSFAACCIAPKDRADPSGFHLVNHGKGF